MNWITKLFGTKSENINKPQNNEFIIGDKFPWKNYNTPGEHTYAVPNEDCMDIVISLPNLSMQEESAIGDEEFEVYVAMTKCLPVIILKFGNTFRADMTLNVLKIKQEYINRWFLSRDNLVRIFLLEGNDATLQCMRTFEFKHFDKVRNVCKNQMDKTSESIDAHIKDVYSQFTLDMLMMASDFHFKVPAALVL